MKLTRRQLRRLVMESVLNESGKLELGRPVDDYNNQSKGTLLLRGQRGVGDFFIASPDVIAIKNNKFVESPIALGLIYSGLEYGLLPGKFDLGLQDIKDTAAINYEYTPYVATGTSRGVIGADVDGIMTKEVQVKIGTFMREVVRPLQNENPKLFKTVFGTAQDMLNKGKDYLRSVPKAPSGTSIKRNFDDYKSKTSIGLPESD